MCMCGWNKRSIIDIVVGRRCGKYVNQKTRRHGAGDPGGKGGKDPLPWNLSRAPWLVRCYCNIMVLYDYCT